MAMAIDMKKMILDRDGSRSDPHWQQAAEAGNVHRAATLFACEAH